MYLLKTVIFHSYVIYQRLHLLQAVIPFCIDLASEYRKISESETKKTQGNRLCDSCVTHIQLHRQRRMWNCLKTARIYEPTSTYNIMVLMHLVSTKDHMFSLTGFFKRKTYPKYDQHLSTSLHFQFWTNHNPHGFYSTTNPHRLIVIVLPIGDQPWEKKIDTVDIAPRAFAWPVWQSHQWKRSVTRFEKKHGRLRDRYIYIYA